MAAARLLVVNMAIVTTYLRDLRALHGAAPLAAVAPLQSFAEQWAGGLAQSGLPLRHSSASWGENIALTAYYAGRGDDGTSNVIDAINMWYAEVAAYDYGRAAYTAGTGHFTQLVWRASRGYGVGAYYDGKAGVYVVMEYDPAGNYAGGFRDNVMPAYTPAPLKGPPPRPPSPRLRGSPPACRCT